MKKIMVSSKSSKNLLAGEIANMIREEGVAELQPAGTAALSIAVLAVAEARKFLNSSNIDLAIVPSVTQPAEGENGGAVINLTVIPR